MKSLFSILSLPFLIVITAQNVSASSTSEVSKKPVRTNINEVSMEFEENIPDKAELGRNIEDLRSIGVTGAETADMNYILGSDDMSKVSSEVTRLSTTGEYDLEDAGRMEKNKPENSYLDDFEIDYSKPGATAHKKDAETIISATEKRLGELTKGLRDIGIDCRESTKDRRIKDPYLIENEREVHKEVEFDQNFCEQVRNQYSCTSNLKLTCKHKYSLPLEEGRFLTSLPKSYDPASGILTFGWPHNFTQVGGQGIQYDYRINFRIDALEAVNEFALQEIGYDDFIRITINGHQIFAGPFDGDRLELRKDFICYEPSGYPSYGVKIDASEHLHSAEQNTWRLVPRYINLRGYLREGENSIDVRLIVGGMGGIWLKFHARVNACNSWNETWEEQCTHTK